MNKERDQAAEARSYEVHRDTPCIEHLRIFTKADFCAGWDARDEEVAELQEELHNEQILNENEQNRLKSEVERLTMQSNEQRMKIDYLHMGGTESEVESLKAEVDRLTAVLDKTVPPDHLEALRTMRKADKYLHEKELDRWREMAGRLARQLSFYNGEANRSGVTSLQTLEAGRMAVTEFDKLMKECGE